MNKKWAKLKLNLLMFFCLTGVSGAVFSQQLDSDQIKVVYLYNFIKHIHWPEEQQKSSFVVAVYNDKAFYQVLANALNHREVKGKPLSVIAVTTASAAKAADMLFVPASFNNKVTEIAVDIRNSFTLLVTDNSTDKHNVMLNLQYNEDNSAISFEVNKSNIIYEQLDMSAELLILGGTELDVATLYRETELAMQVIKKREIELNEQLTLQEQQLKNTNERLIEVNENLALRENMAKLQQNELIILKKDIEQQRYDFAAKEYQFKAVLQQLSEAKQDLLAQQEAIFDKENKNKVMAQRIEENKHILEQQINQLDLQDEQLSNKNKELAVKTEEIDQQRLYILITTMLVILAVIVSIMVILLFIKNKRTTKQLETTLINLETMQDQLIQSEKMASLGTLTAGVAHEINTPLGIAVTSTSSALDLTSEIRQKFEKNELRKSALGTYLNAIEQSCSLNTHSLGRVIELLNNFKQVAVDQVVGEERDIELVSYIGEVMSTLSAEMKIYRVQYEYLGPAVINITTIPGALAQVITNLVTNSLKHGFEGKTTGLITIDINTETKDSIHIIYKDDGIGMSEVVLDNIFEPFYTTKRNSGGTGLGMNIVYNLICQKLRGKINIVSAPNMGTKITVTLPITI